jgi:glucose dehydrogenase
MPALGQCRITTGYGSQRSARAAHVHAAHVPKNRDTLSSCCTPAQLGFFLLIVSSLVLAQEWRRYGSDPGGARYSPLKQIDKSNVTRLKVAWT